VGNFVLMQTKSINPVTLQEELLSAYETFYSYSNILRSAINGKGLQSTIVKGVGRYLLRSGRAQVKEHVEWMRSKGFTKDFDEFEPIGSAPADPIRPTLIQPEATGNQSVLMQSG
jgi:hypothetical protein